MIKRLTTYLVDHPGKTGTLAGWYQQGCSILGTFLAVPFVLKILQPDQAGLWFTFLSLLGVLQLTDFGFSLVLSRQVAYSLGASEKTEAHGTDFLNIEPGWAGVSHAYHMCRLVFRTVSLLGVVLLVIGYHGVLPLGKIHSALGGSTVWVWYMMGLTTIFQIQAKPHQALLEGMSRVYITRLILGTTQLLSGLGVICALLLHGRLLAMAAVTLTAWSLHYAALRLCAYKLARIDWHASWRHHTGMLRRYIRVALPLGIVSASAFLLMYVQVPIVAFLLGPTAVPPYYLALRIGSVINQACLQPLFPQIPLFTTEIAAKRTRDAAQRLIRCITLVSALLILADCIFFFFSPLLVKLWLGPGRYVSTPVLLIIMADLLLRDTTGLWGQFVLASGTNPLTGPMLVAGCMTLAGALILGPLFGITGVAAASLIAGLSSTYWFFPIRGMRLLKTLWGSSHAAPYSDITSAGGGCAS